MRINMLTVTAFELNAAIDTGKHNDVSVDDVKRAIQGGAVFDFLEQQLGTDIDLSLLDHDDRAELTREWLDLADAVDEKRKMGVRRNGLCLLVAYVLEGIQRRTATINRTLFDQLVDSIREDPRLSGIAVESQTDFFWVLIGGPTSPWTYPVDRQQLQEGNLAAYALSIVDQWASRAQLE
jgi:hypothetical protein